MVVRLAAAILLGVVMTIAVAWLLALNVDGSIRARSWPSYEVALKIIPTPRGFTPGGVYFAQVTRSQHWGTDIVEVSTTWADDGRPSWGSPHALVEGTSFEAEMREKFDRGEAPIALWRADGWPFQALSAEARWGSSSDETVSVRDGILLGSNLDVILLGSDKVLPGDRMSILPRQPIWPGFIIDTILYASLVFVLLSLRDIRCMVRRRRGLCIHCAYDLRGAPPDSANCPECGRSRTATIRASSHLLSNHSSDRDGG